MKTKPQPYHPSTLPFSFSGTVDSGFMHISSGISLLVTTFKPEKKSNYPPVIMVPGLLSVIENFRHVLQELTRGFSVHLVETREKQTSLCSSREDFGIPVMAKDIAMVIEQLGLNEKSYILLGYSMGATVILEGLPLFKAKPLDLVLVEPTFVFRFPGWSRLLAKFSAPIYGLLKPFLKWYIRNFRVNIKEDPEMYAILSRILDMADPYKICAAIPALSAYRAWERLQPITVPSLVIGAASDRFHSHDEILHLCSLITNCTFVDLENNRRSHSGEVVNEIKRFLEK